MYMYQGHKHILCVAACMQLKFHGLNSFVLNMQVFAQNAA